MFFSIIIPARNEARDIERCLESVIAQEFEDYEVIVVDDGSTDETPEIVMHYSAMYPEKVKSSHSNGCGPGFAKNVGSEMARGDIIFFMDADEIINKEFLGYCKDHFTDSSVAGIIIALEFESVNTLGRIQGSWKTTRQGSHLGLFPRLIRKEIFKTVGRYDASLIVGEDYDLWVRLKAFSENRQIHFVSEEKAVIRHVDDDSLYGVFKRAMRFGRVLLPTTKKHPRFAGSILLWSLFNALSFWACGLIFFYFFLSIIYFSMYLIIWSYYIVKSFIVGPFHTRIYFILVPFLQAIIGSGVMIGVIESIIVQ